MSLYPFLQPQSKLPTVLMQILFSPHGFKGGSHSLTSSQAVEPSPTNPVLHLQSYSGSVLSESISMQSAFSWHPSFKQGSMDRNQSFLGPRCPVLGPSCPYIPGFKQTPSGKQLCPDILEKGLKILVRCWNQNDFLE